MESESRVDSDAPGGGGFFSPVLACLFIFLLLFLRTILVAYYTPSPGMIDTLKINDRVFVNRFAYAFSEPKIGDIVVFRVPEDIPHYDPEKSIWLKRIVGVGGDTIAIENDRLIINGIPAKDPPFLGVNSYFPRSLKGKVFEEVTVPESHAMVFGDNSINSYDSRYWGPVHVDRIIGKVVVRFWPPSRIGPVRGESARPRSAN